MGKMTDTVKPQLALTVHQGRAENAAALWPSLPQMSSESYLWLHFDLNKPGFEAWAHGNLPESVARLFLQRETRPRCDVYETGLYINLRGINITPKQSPEDMVSLRIWVDKNLVVTAGRQPFWAVNAVHTNILNGNAPKSAGLLVSGLLIETVKRLENVLLELEDDTDSVEEAVLSEGQFDTKKIVLTRQVLIKLRRYMSPQREALEALLEHTDRLHEKKAPALLRDVTNKMRWSIEAIDAHRDRLISLHEYVDATQARILSKNSYLFSAVAVIFLPISFLVGLFGVNLGGIPGGQFPYAFLLLSLFSLVFALSVYIILKKHHWL